MIPTCPRSWSGFRKGMLLTSVVFTMMLQWPDRWVLLRHLPLPQSHRVYSTVAIGLMCPKNTLRAKSSVWKTCPNSQVTTSTLWSGKTRWACSGTGLDLFSRCLEAQLESPLHRNDRRHSDLQVG